jgi:3-oxoacyl-[acyl-carrier-protein] synthase-3
MKHAKLTHLAYHLPEGVLTNDELAALYPGWSAEKILSKTGVRVRHIAGPHETSADLALRAGQKLLAENAIPPESVDFLIFCTQTPDYFLPSSSCLLQDKLRLTRSCGAIDVNLGCSGFVYSLALAKGLVESGQAQRVMILTADTYSKLIHPMDKSVRTLFSDAGGAALVDAVESEHPKILPCLFGTDGRGAEQLIVPTGGFREARSAQSAVVNTDDSGNSRSRDNLFMDGAEILTFSLREVPLVVARLLERSKRTIDTVDAFVFHQGSQLMLEMLRKKLAIPPQKFVIDLEETGNTVSSTLPVTLARRFPGPRTAESTVMLVGFGVGLSWAGTVVQL